MKWGGNLMAEMTAGGILCYYFLIEQIGFKMTPPPRSEAWAVILGAGMAMIWHMARENRIAPPLSCYVRYPWRRIGLRLWQFSSDSRKCTGNTF